jgi:hypothetical protein
VRRRIDRAGLALFAISTVWFVIALLLEFRSFTGYTKKAGSTWPSSSCSCFRR